MSAIKRFRRAVRIHEGTRTDDVIKALDALEKEMLVEFDEWRKEKIILAIEFNRYISHNADEEQAVYLRVLYE